MTEIPLPPTLLPHLRIATIADAAGVAALLDALGYPCERDDAARRIALVEHDSRQRLIVADHHGDCCGLVALCARYSFAHDTDICHISALVVAPTYQHRGIGRQLLREAHAWARAIGASRIEIASATHRESAHAFYRHCGYPESGLRFVKFLGDA
jgi:GNAT superfamily N-acetyltransferase